MRCLSFAAGAAALTLVAGTALPAQPGLRIFRNFDGAERENRAVLGVSTSSGGARDTLGVLITGITPGGPAERAGLEEGNRIAAVNGTNLRLAAADAGEPDMNGLATRRLTRELGKAKPGDQVELRLWQNGQFSTVRLRTVAAESLPGRRVSLSGLSREDRERERERRTREREDRAVLGLDLQPTGGRRDTLGVLIIRVVEGGPAERAGLLEGDRVATVNGVDLRVARDDAGDGWVSNAKSARFTREMQRVKAGAQVELRVYSGGQYKTVRVAAARSGDVYKGDRNTFFFRNATYDGEMIAPMPPMPPEPPMAPEPPAPPGGFILDTPLFDVRVDTDAIARRVNDAMQRAGDALQRSGDAVRSINVQMRPGVYRI